MFEYLYSTPPARQVVLWLLAELAELAELLLARYLDYPLLIGLQTKVLRQQQFYQQQPQYTMAGRAYRPPLGCSVQNIYKGESCDGMKEEWTTAAYQLMGRRRECLIENIIIISRALSGVFCDFEPLSRLGIYAQR